MALNKYALAAYHLHPTFNDDKLTKEEKQKANSFLFNQLLD